MSARGRFTKPLVALAVLAGLAPAVPAIAQGAPEDCAAIAVNAERLACYDAIFRPNGPEIAAAEVVVLESERVIPARPSGRAPATITIACTAGTVNVSFGFANQLVSNTGDFAAVTLQVDQNATAVRTLDADAGNTVLTFPNARDTAAFLDSLVGGNNLRVRMTPVRQRSVAVDFRLHDDEAAILALRENCA